MPEDDCGQLESIFEQGYVEELGITPVDEEIDVFCSRKCLFEADIAFPMTVADAFLLQRAEQSPDEHLAQNSRSAVVRLNRYGFTRPTRWAYIVQLERSRYFVTHHSTPSKSNPTARHVLSSRHSF